VAAGFLLTAEEQLGLAVIAVRFLAKAQVVVAVQKAPWLFRLVITLLLLVVAGRLEQMALGQVL